MLSATAIMLSVFSFLIVLYVMNGMNVSIKDRLIALEPHAVLQIPEAKQASQVLARPEVQELLKDPALRVAPFESQDVILRTASGQFRGAVARGLDEDGLRDFLQEVRRLRPAAADVPLEEVPAEGEVLIGIDLARALDLFEGDHVLVMAPESLLLPAGEAPRTEKLRVKQIIATNLADLDAQLFLYQRGTSLRALATSPARQAGVEVRFPDGGQADAWKKSFGEHAGLRVETWSERNSALFFALKMEKLMIAIFLGLAGLIAGSSILTVMALLLSQKRRDIALLRVIGLSAQDSIFLFTRIGLTLAGTAAFIGAAAGISAGLWIEAHPLNVLPEIYYDSQIPARFDGVLTLGTFVVAALLCFFGAWVPSRNAAGIEPSRVLRQKN